MSLFDKTIDRRKQGSCKWDIALSAVGDFEDTLALSTADTDFPTAPKIKEALLDAVENTVFGYTNPTNAFYDSVISWMQRRHDWAISKEWIAGSPGIVSSMFYFLHAFTQPKDGVLIQPPVYAPFSHTVRTTGRSVVANPLIYENGTYRIDFADLETKAAEANVKMMFFCNPHNPVGRCWSYEEVERVAAICAKHDILLVSDEIHFDFVFPPFKHTVAETLPKHLTKNIAVCTAPSKSFNLAGMQLSNIIIQDETIRKQFTNAQFRCGSHLLNVFSYIACTAAYNDCADWLDEQLTYIQENDRLVRAELSANRLPITLPPLEATYLQWLDFSQTHYPNGRERQRFLQKTLHLNLENGLVFGKEGEHFERLNIACPHSVVEEVLQRLKSGKLTLYDNTAAGG
jgi:cystathionine beta-lyase